MGLFKFLSKLTKTTPADVPTSKSIPNNKAKVKIEVSVESAPVKEPVPERPIKKSQALNKGVSIFEIPVDYTIVDLETTGLAPADDAIIEVAAFKYKDNQLVDKYTTLIKPIEEYTGTVIEIDDFITNLTGITNEMVSTAPTFKDIANDLYDFLSGEVIVGHNVNFDVNFLRENFLSLDMPFLNNYVDTLRLARRLFPELPHHRLSDLADHFELQEVHHRAVGDVEITKDVLEIFRNHIKENNINLADFLNHRLDLKKIVVSKPENIDPSHMFYGKNIVFTGALEKYTRAEAAQIVVNIGGICQNGINKSTNFLVIGDMDAKTIKDGKSTKVKKAEEKILKGQDLQILTESVFYDLIENQ